MKNYKLILVIVTLFQSINCFGANNQVDFTEYQGSVRAAGLGYAYTAIPGEVDGMYFNPAGNIFSSQGLRLKTNSNKNFNAVENTQAFLSWKEIGTDFSLALGYIRDQVSGVPITDFQDGQNVQIGSFNTSKQNIALNYSSFVISNQLAFGINIKNYQYDLSYGTASGMGIDLGLLQKFDLGDKTFINFGAVIYNLNGTPIKWNTGTLATMAKRYSFGTAFGLGIIDRQLIISLAYDQNEKNQSNQFVGTEYEIFPQLLKIRSGLQNKSLTYGIGFEYSGFTLDYAEVENEDLGRSKLFSMGVSL